MYKAYNSFWSSIPLGKYTLVDLAIWICSSSHNQSATWVANFLPLGLGRPANFLHIRQPLNPLLHFFSQDESWNLKNKIWPDACWKWVRGESARGFTWLVGRSWQYLSDKTRGLVLRWEGVLVDRLFWGGGWWSLLWWDLQCWFLRSNQSIPPVFCLYFYQFARFPTMRANNPFTPDPCQLPQKKIAIYDTQKKKDISV